MIPMCLAGQVMLPYYECLPEEQLEGLQHDRDYECPKVRLFGPDELYPVLRSYIQNYGSGACLICP